MQSTESNDSQTAAFMVVIESIRLRLDALYAHTDDHFCVTPDDVTWANVGDAFAVAAHLDQALSHLGLPIPTEGGF